MYDVNRVIDIALAEVGYLEKSKKAYQKDSSVLKDKTKGAGSDNYTKYGYDMHKIYPSVMDFPAAWCDCFVDWCFYSAYGITTAKSLLNGNFDDYTVASKNMYVKHGAYYRSGPKVGDQIFFKNSKGTSVGHTGIVYKVDSNKVYTVEGNTSSAAGVVANGGCVAKKSYLLTNSRIDGYGRPNYNMNNSTNETQNALESTKNSENYKKYTGNSIHIDDVLKAIGVPDKYRGTYFKRKPIAEANGIKSYSGTMEQNLQLIKLAKTGLKKPNS